MSEMDFRMFERLTALVSRKGVVAGETGEVLRVYGDGSVELEISNERRPVGVPFFGLLAGQLPYTQRVSARFAPDEVARAKG